MAFRGSEEWTCLSLLQPWASALFVPGLKSIETRGWNTNYRGRLYIHASKRPSKDGRIITERTPGLPCPISLGCIIGHVDLVAVHNTEVLRDQISETEKEWGDYGPGRYGWITKDPVLFSFPISASGQLGLWKYKIQQGAAT